MTIRKTHEADDSTLSPNSSLRERALATYHEKTAGKPVDGPQITAEESLRSIHELQVHQIELELQNEELRQTQIALEESRKRYLDLYDRAPVGYCLVSHEGLIQEANLTLAQMLGVPTPSLMKERFSKFIYECDQDRFYFLRRRVLLNPEPQTCELRLKTSDMNAIWVQLSVSLVSNDDESASLRVALMDIDSRIRAETEKASLEAQLRESQKMEAMGTLAGGIAHDFNNILAVILSNTELARNFTAHGEKDLVHCVEEIQKAGERARDLVRQLLAFCRRQPTDRKSIALAPVIDESVRLLRSTIPARLSLTFTSALAVPNVLADFTQIEQVIINLATNAVQAMDGNAGSIKIHLDTVERAPHTLSAESNLPSKETMVRLTFTDDGPGMDASVVDRIFEPFFTTKSIDEGTGLGLAVVHGIVLAHDAEITVDSQPGHGATFTIYFPPANFTEIESTIDHFVEPADLESLSTTATLVSSVAATCRVLYIDDDEMVLQSIVNLLGHYGIQVRGYSDQLTALVALRATKDDFDIVVTDYNMPGISGLDVARQVRDIRPDLPVILTSGFIDQELHSKAEAAGVRALIPKPFAAKYFCNLVKDLLGKAE